MKDIFDRYWAMCRDARERGMEIPTKQLCILALADVIEERGLAIETQLKEIDKTLVAISKNVS